MLTKKTIILGCGIAAAICLAGITVVILFFVYVAQDVKGVGVSIESQPDVLVGQTFELNVVVTNERPKKELALSDIDVAEEYLEGFTIVAVEPTPKSNSHMSVDNSRSFTFGVRVPPRTSKTFKFTLKAEKSGVYRGDVDVSEGMRFITAMAQTSVKEKE